MISITPPTPFPNLNRRAARLLQQARDDADALKIDVSESGTATVLDFGVKADGGLEAGLLLARLCMAGLGRVELQNTCSRVDVPQVFVHTDHPIAACLQSQYAGWKIATKDFFAMGSGPMRALAGAESLYQELPAREDGSSAIGVLESAALATPAAISLIQDQIGSEVPLSLAVAPTASIAGNLQVVARSVETALHKLHELHFPLHTIVSGCGTAPLPPVAKTDLAGIGRTNDSILYGAQVNLWVNCDNEVIEEFGPQTPSCSSPSHGTSFLELFVQANHDFYALDKSLFSPAVVIFHNLASGDTYRFGRMVPELLLDSFGL
ncbi:MAG: methenyltetrahydromethanopterin cyclohydrolase [Planctomycetaceae bacterium]